MEDLKCKAINLLKEFKGENYAFGLNVLERVGDFAQEFGQSALLIGYGDEWFQPVLSQVVDSLQRSDVHLAGNNLVEGAQPNAPREDVYRLESYLLHYRPDCIVVCGGGSQIDAAKSANVLASLGEYSPEIETYFCTNKVTEFLAKTGKKLLPLIAVQTASSSAAHLTKYSNITDPVEGQKKLIVDNAIIPTRAVFDYSITQSMPVNLTIDGALDGISHSLEVFYGAKGEQFERITEIALLSIELAVTYTPKLLQNPEDLEGRFALGLATDLGGYAIMIGGTNGAHLTSFSLVDVASHGRACGLMNPYYTVFFASVIEEKLKLVGDIFKREGYIKENLKELTGRNLGIAVAKGMIAFQERIKSPTKLSDLPGFTDEHLKRALEAAKNPQLEMKLKNMPVALNASLVDEYMGPILQAAKTGDFGLIKNLE